jgi:hypothetical protein
MFSPLALLNALAPTIVTAVAPGARATREAIPVSEAVMVTWTRLVAECRAAGIHRSVKLTDALIAATAIEQAFPSSRRTLISTRSLARVPRCP